MFSNKVIGRDNFLEMPDSTQNLYFHLSMHADDDGFVDNWRTILRMTGKKEDDFRLLVTKSFIIPFQSGVIVIKDWRINNYIRSDRKTPTRYLDEKEQLVELENKSYELKNSNCQPLAYHLPTTCLPNGSIDKYSIDKYNTYCQESDNSEYFEAGLNPAVVRINKASTDTNLTSNERAVGLGTNASAEASTGTITPFSAVTEAGITTSAITKRTKISTTTASKEKDVIKVFGWWNEQGIIKHQKPTEEITKAVAKFLKNNKIGEAKKAIERYKRVLVDKRYFFNYKWSLKDFLNRKNGAVDFLDDGSKWNDYCQKIGINADEETQKQEENGKQVSEGVFKL